MKKEELLRRELYAPADLHIREAEDGKESRTIEGYAILFNTPSELLWCDDEDEAREVILPEAVTREFLDGCDIKMTMFHDRQLILARSKNGSGTLSYKVDEKGVNFSFEAPHTLDGDKALELVRRGDISGCSFAFSTYYWDRDYVERDSKVVNGRNIITYKVRAIRAIHDFTLAADPAYPDTSVNVRELLREQQPATEGCKEGKYIEQVRQMREQASKGI